MRALALLLCVAGCGGHVDAIEPEPAPFGWCCDGICGLDPYEADLFEQCECPGIVHPVADTRGACLEAP